MQRNVNKFHETTRNDETVKTDGQCFEVGKSVKVLDLTISDLKWNSHVENIVLKASKTIVFT